METLKTPNFLITKTVAGQRAARLLGEQISLAQGRGSLDYRIEGKGAERYEVLAVVEATYLDEVDVILRSNYGIRPVN